MKLDLDCNQVLFLVIAFMLGYFFASMNRSKVYEGLDSCSADYRSTVCLDELNNYLSGIENTYPSIDTTFDNTNILKKLICETPNGYRDDATMLDEALERTRTPGLLVPHARASFRNIGRQILSHLNLPDNLDGHFSWDGSRCVTAQVPPHAPSTTPSPDDGH